MVLECFGVGGFVLVLVVVLLCWWFCVGDFVVVFLWWCLRGGVCVVVFVWWCLCGGVFVVVFESRQHIVWVIRTKVPSIKVVTNHSIGTCSVDLYILYLFETSGTASCGTTGIFMYIQHIATCVGGMAHSLMTFVPSIFFEENACKAAERSEDGWSPQWHKMYLYGYIQYTS